MNALPFLASLALTFFLTPHVKRWAVLIGAVDHPDVRKVHQEVMPRLGGLAVYTGFWFGVFVYGFLHPGEMPIQMAGVFMGALVLVLLGVYDDIGDAPVRVKFPVQIAAAHLAYCFGVRFDLFGPLLSSLGIGLPEPVVAFATYALTILWLVGVTNAVNFSDGLDGLCGGLSLAVTLWLLVFATLTPVAHFGVLLTAMAGGLIAFARYNWFPASIFLGDTGSTFLGFALANLSLLVCHTAQASLGMRFIPVLLLAVPLSDALYAILRRFALGVNIFKADRGHLHHRLLAMGHKPPKAVRLLISWTFLAGGYALLFLHAGDLAALALFAGFAVLDVIVARRLQLFDRHVIEAGVPVKS